ncbi:MAG: hypothetical protein IJI57_04735 [Flexilinea sp.]|nr:hypothetical protein [Flexilinea sp.]
MMKSEFEKLLGFEVANSDYKLIDYVYTWHPCISDTEGKKQITDLYRIGGMSIIKSMVEVAKKVQIIESKMNILRIEMRKLETERENLRAGKWDVELTESERRGGMNGVINANA